MSSNPADESVPPTSDLHPTNAGPAPTHSPSKSTSSTVVVADPKPLSLLATAGVLHHEGMRCICARNTDAVLKAFELEYSEGSSGLSSLPIRVDESHPHPSPLSSSAQPSLIDLIVWDVAEDPMSVLTTLQQIRQFSAFQHLPAVLLADAKWAGLEKKTEAEIAPTHCLFKPIDPKSLITIVQPLLWMPSLQSTHRQRGSRPNRPGWVTL